MQQWKPELRKHINDPAYSLSALLHIHKTKQNNEILRRP
jgi:hypothetical protein